MAYSQLYQCPVMLLYPHHGGLPSPPVHKPYAIAHKGAERRLHVATLDLTDKSQAQVEALRSLVSAALKEGALPENAAA